MVRSGRPGRAGPGSPSEPVGTDVASADPQSFIVKIWREGTAEEMGQVIWRGHITHVPGGERRYLKDLAEVTAFIKTYLVAMGVTFDSARE
jgi:hypothetical protein